LTNVAPRLRILHLNGRSDLGGGSTHTYRLLRAIDTRQFQMFVACPDEPPYFALLAQIPGLRVFPLPLRHLRLANLIALIRIVRTQRIECVHSQGKAAGIWARALKCFFPRLQVVHQYHGIHYGRYPAWLQGSYLRFERALSRLTDVVVHVSESEQQQANRLRLCAVHKQRLIRNGVETRRDLPLTLEQARLRLNVPTPRPICIVLARYSYQKNLACSFDVVARLERSETPVHFIVVGGADDVERHEVEAQVRQSGVAASVTLLGPREDVFECLRAADIYLSTSRWEGLPLGVLEAMSMGLPVVASRVTGHDGVVTPDCGFLVDADDVEGFARAVSRLAGDRDVCRRMGAAARERVSREFSLERMVAAHEALYRELAAARCTGARRGP